MKEEESNPTDYASREGYPNSDYEWFSKYCNIIGAVIIVFVGFALPYLGEACYEIRSGNYSEPLNQALRNFMNTIWSVLRFDSFAILIFGLRLILVALSLCLYFCTPLGKLRFVPIIAAYGLEFYGFQQTPDPFIIFMPLLSIPVFVICFIIVLVIYSFTNSRKLDY
ncbi:MAG: hypothetical protein ACRC2T_02350 [Thermoguttaceae bacterium]